MKALKVTSITAYGEQTLSHPMSDLAPEDMMTVAILKGVIQAGSVIKSFEIVEA